MSKLTTILKTVDEMEVMAKAILNNCSRVRQELAQFSGSVPAGTKKTGRTPKVVAITANFKKRFQKKIS